MPVDPVCPPVHAPQLKDAALAALGDGRKTEVQRVVQKDEAVKTDQSTRAEYQSMKPSEKSGRFPMRMENCGFSV